MANQKDVSSLSQHYLYKKRGEIVTPFNEHIGDKLFLSSWSKERLPEYLWLGLILLYYGREEGFEKAGILLKEIANNFDNLSHPQMSKIFHLSDKDKKDLFDIIVSVIEPEVLSPLTVLYHDKTYSIFYEYFFVKHLRFEERNTYLNLAIKTYYSSHSNETTDLRYLTIGLHFFRKKICIAEGLNEVPKALVEYPKTAHDNDKMKIYRPIIRNIESSINRDIEQKFNNNFWKEIGMISKCKPMIIKYDSVENNKSEKFKDKFQEILEYILVSKKGKSLSEEKFDVIMGSATYSLKIYKEIIENSLGTHILARHGLRTILEVYIMLKYLLKKESEKPDIWQEYKIYGISKFKLILLKIREYDYDNEESHIILPIIDSLVNEIKWEEFIDIDLKYFDKKGIREKSKEVGEKDLYDTIYDYDNNYVHGLWGAIRENAMLHCDNPNHKYHCIPDIYSSQEMPDIKPDCYKVMKNILNLLIEIYEVPDSIVNKD